MRAAAGEMNCRNNMQQLELATRQFLSTHGGKFVLTAATFKKRLEPFYPGIDRIFHCLQDPGSADSYTFNHNLEGVKAKAIMKPEQTVMIYEGKDGRLDFRHNDYTTVAFADGHVERVNRQQAKSLRWEP